MVDIFLREEGKTMKLAAGSLFRQVMISTQLIQFNLIDCKISLLFMNGGHVAANLDNFGSTKYAGLNRRILRSVCSACID